MGGCLLSNKTNSSAGELSVEAGVLTPTLRMRSPAQGDWNGLEAAVLRCTGLASHLGVGAATGCGCL